MIKILLGIVIGVGIGYYFQEDIEKYLEARQQSNQCVEEGGVWEENDCIFGDNQTVDLSEDVQNSDEQRSVARVGELAELVVVTSPVPNSDIDSPLAVTGMAPGNWFFEATAPIDVVDWNGKIITETYIQAEGNWMTEDLVPFSGVIVFDKEEFTPYTRATLILRRHNASGLPENDAAVEVPLTVSM
jgi:hypothetical protein